MHPAPQGVQLRLIALPPVNRQHMKAGEMSGVALERLGHLQRELARGDQHQHLGVTSAEIDPRQRGQGERRRLARAVWACPSMSAPESSTGIVAA